MAYIRRRTTTYRRRVTTRRATTRRAPARRLYARRRLARAVPAARPYRPRARRVVRGRSRWARMQM